MRPANMVTAVADVLAGMAIAGFFTIWIPDQSYLQSIFLLCMSTACLYAGGVVFNDVFDAELDKVERPERAIPSAVVSKRNAIQLGAFLLTLGFSCAAFVNFTAGILAAAILVLALVYDKWGKHQRFLGPLNMGLCRGLNLLLGISVIPQVLANWWFISCIPIVYIASITMISRGEVYGSKRTPLQFAAVLYALVIASILYFSFIEGTIIFAIAFLSLFAWMIFKPLINAIQEPSGPNIGKSVKVGVIALILMNASWAATAGALYIALIILLLLPLSIWLGKKFAVT